MKPITTDFCGCPIVQKIKSEMGKFLQSLDLCPKLSDYEFQKEVIKFIVSSVPSANVWAALAKSNFICCTEIL